VILALLTAVAATGCVYRLDIQQGNLLTLADIDKVTVGMTRSQVRYLLGTPMVSDPFAPQRWDYVYRMQYGRSSNVDAAHFVVRFDGDKVSSVERVDMPEPTRQARRKSWAFWKSQESGETPDLPPEPAVPPVNPPSPDANNPGGA
jgi:outer membrane protein assembly factor BamE